MANNRRHIFVPVIFFIVTTFMAVLPVAASPWRADLSGGALYAPSYGSDVALLPAYGFGIGTGVELVMNYWIPIRGELGVYSIGASAWDPTLFRYRAFWGYRLAAMTGLRVPVGSGELDFLAGGALSASRFTGLSVVTAYASIVGEMRFLHPVSFSFLKGREANIFATVPIEYMFRGNARTIATGLEIGVGFQLSKGASK